MLSFSYQEQAIEMILELADRYMPERLMMATFYTLQEISCLGSPLIQPRSIHLHLVNTLDPFPPLTLLLTPSLTLYPPPHPLLPTSSSSAHPFPTSHRFLIPLPSDPIPGSLHLPGARGEVKYELEVLLRLNNGEEVREKVVAEGTPEEVGQGSIGDKAEDHQVLLERDGARVRVVADREVVRVGSGLKVGVEVGTLLDRGTAASSREKAPLELPPQAPRPGEGLRGLRRVRVECWRKVVSPPAPTAPQAYQVASCSTSPLLEEPSPLETHTLLYKSGKSCRYPGPSNPPIRLLFNLPPPTLHLTTGNEPTWGELTQSTAYHDISFFVRVSIGFGEARHDGASASHAKADWVVDIPIRVVPKKWREPNAVVLERGLSAGFGIGGDGTAQDTVGDQDEERELYRRKGRDVVGDLGTIRATDADGAPPPFDPAGPSQAAELPTFLESQTQSLHLPPPAAPPLTQRLQPVDFDCPTTPNGLEAQGELATWQECDGYETFSVAPPSAERSVGAGGSMDPPNENDDDERVEGLVEGQSHGERLALMETLGLGEGTRVVDMQVSLLNQEQKYPNPCRAIFRLESMSHRSPRCRNTSTESLDLNTTLRRALMRRKLLLALASLRRHLAISTNSRQRRVGCLRTASNLIVSLYLLTCTMRHNVLDARVSIQANNNTVQAVERSVSSPSTATAAEATPPAGRTSWCTEPAPTTSPSTAVTAKATLFHSQQPRRYRQDG